MRAVGRSEGSEHQRLPLALLGGLLVAVPVAAALLGFVGDTWHLTGDWASIDLRTSQVGTADTPLIGAYSTRGWAHPGPSIYWLAAPLHVLSGGDPRSLLWTAAAINLGAIAGIAWVARRRGGDAMALVALLACALLARGMGPGRVVDIWNPMIPLFSLVLVAFLAWSAATGERRHAIGALMIGALIAQAHVSMVALLVVIAGWAVAWTLLERRTHPADASSAEDARATSPRWAAVLGVGTALAVVAWIPPLLDEVARTGNLGTVVRYFLAGDGHPVGLRAGLGLVSRHVRPDGPWLGGAEPAHGISVLGSGPVPALAMLVALAFATWALWRRGRRTEAAGASLALALVAASIPIASRVDQPTYDYLVRWISAISAFAWFWLAWSAWILVVRPALRRRGPLPRTALAGVGLVAIALVAVSTVSQATQLWFPAEREGLAVTALVDDLAEVLPKGEPVRIEPRGDDFGNVTSGIIVGLRRRGFDVVTDDGWTGLKYGPDAVWRPGDAPADEVVTVAVDYPYNLTSTRHACEAAGAEPIATYDELTPAQRQVLTDLSAKALFEPDALTSRDQRIADELGPEAFAVTVFRWRDLCAPPP